MAFHRCYGCMEPIDTELVCPHCGHDQRQNNKTHQLPAGTVLQGRYKVGRTLGQGGFGITYIGYDQVLESVVAIKEYYPSGYVVRDCMHSLRVTAYMGEKQAYFDRNRERFLREAKALTRFADRPEVVHVQNFFQENNAAYIVMEYVRGVNLRQHIIDRGGKLDVEETFMILESILKALAAVHQENLVHRDISPDNIMLLPDGKVKVLDFGAARDVDTSGSGADMPKSTEAILKHGFAPIEQYQKHGGLGPWTDIYATCATAYYCMTGQVPPDAPARMLEDAHPAWEEIPGLSAARRKGLEKGMEVLARDRTPSAQALYDLLFAPEGETAQEERNAEAKASASEKKKKRVPYIVVAVAALAVAAVGLLAFWKPWDIPQLPVTELLMQTQPSAAVEETAAAPTGVTEAPTEETELSVTEPSVEIPPETTIAPTELISTEPVETEPEYPTHVWINNLLVNSTPPEYLSDISTFSAFGSYIPRNEIYSVTFLESVEDAPGTAWDASQYQNRSVLAWVEENGSGYDLYIGGTGGVNAVYCCKDLFAGYTNLRTVKFGRAFHMEGSPTLENMFYNCGMLESVDVSRFDTSTVQYFTNMFYGCRSLTGLDVSGFNTEKASQMAGMFYNCAKVPVLDVSGFETKNVLDMANMFSGCSSVEVLDVSGFNTRRVTDFHGMFQGCSNVEVLDVSGFDTSKSMDLSYMFSGCRAVKKLDVTGFKTYLALDVSSMFENCSSLEKLDTGSFNTKNCHSMSAMFSGCSSLKELDISSLTTGQARSLHNMFAGCENLETLDIRKFSTENTTSMAGMFSGCKSLKELDVSKMSTVYVTDMSYMFYNCSGLETLDVRNFMTNRVRDMSYMFYGTTDWIDFNFKKFVTKSVRNYTHFMNDGVIINGQYWEDLFS